jgi:hypothetical protein
MAIPITIDHLRNCGISDTEMQPKVTQDSKGSGKTGASFTVKNKNGGTP